MNNKDAIPASPDAFWRSFSGMLLASETRGEMATLGNRVRELRDRQKLTQDQLAQQTGLSKGFLSDVENDRRQVSAVNLLKIANAVGASLDYLLRGEDAEEAVQRPVVIPRELSEAAEHLGLSYAQTLQLLEAHNSVVARRSDKGTRRFTIDDWKRLHEAIRKVFD
jgi:transcriptional regulator with XRE-family HTH domain